MLESELTKRIRIALSKEGGLWVKVHGGKYQVTGLPDLIGCYQGRFFGLEVKLPGKEGTLTPRQKHILEQINESGGKATMVTSVKQAVDFVRELAKIDPPSNEWLIPGWVTRRARERLSRPTRVISLDFSEVYSPTERGDRR